MIKITIGENEYEVEKGITLEEIVKKYGKNDGEGEIVLAYRNGHLCELFKTVEEDAVISFITTTDKMMNNIKKNQSAMQICINIWFKIR